MTVVSYDRGKECFNDIVIYRDIYSITFSKFVLKTSQMVHVLARIVTKRRTYFLQTLLNDTINY